MQVEAKTVVPTGPEPIFRLYSNVSSWQSWDPDTKEATLSGPFQVGTKGRLVPTKGNAVPMEVTAVETNRSFTVVSKIPLFKMVFEHELRPVPAGTEVTHRVTFSGLLSPVLGRLLASQLRIGLPRTLQSLSKHAQQQHSAV